MIEPDIKTQSIKMNIYKINTISYNSGKNTGLDLFSFLSIMICVMGVLTFIQLLMLSSGSVKVKIVSESATSWQIPYRIFCTGDGVLHLPPAKSSLSVLIQSGNKDRKIQKINSERVVYRSRIKKIFKKTDKPRDVYQIDGQKDMVENILGSIAYVNEVARKLGVLYEEYILFGIYPGGGECYRQFLNKLDDAKYQRIRTGLELLDVNWSFRLE